MCMTSVTSHENDDHPECQVGCMMRYRGEGWGSSVVTYFRTTSRCIEGLSGLSGIIDVAQMDCRHRHSGALQFEDIKHF